jgi:hypothetical protein
MGHAMRAGRRGCCAAMLIVAVSLPTPARSQAGPADTEEALMIPLHPSTPTTVQLPDEILDARIRHRGEFLFEAVGQSLNVRPRPGTPAGTEALVEVETRTERRKFRLRVVARPEDAVRKIELPAAKTVERTAEAQQEAPPVVPAEPEPAASTPATAPAAPALEPRAASEPAPEPARESAEPVTRRAPATAASRAFDLSVHAVVSLGFTALDVRGYKPITARQPHGALGLRLTLAPHDTWWALEASVSGERLAGSMVFDKGNFSELAISGQWLRAELGMRVQVGTRWMPMAYAGLGMQAHLRTTGEELSGRLMTVETMEPGAVLALGMGLQYRAGDVLLGLEFQVRHGGPDDYLSMAALWTVGRFLDQGD